MTSTLEYLGELSVKAIHTRSQSNIVSDAPVDNKGKGANFSPTDYVATSLASCMLTIMGIKCNEKALNMVGAKANVEKIMASDPRRISEINIQIVMPADIDHKNRKILEAAALNCPVAKSLHPDIIQNINFEWK